MIFDAILGAITGLGGAIATGIMNIKTQKLKNEHDIAMVQAETQAMIAETEANIKITETQIQGDLAMAEQSSFDVSQKVGNRVNINNSILEKLFEKKWTTVPGTILVFLLGVVDVLRSAMRPAITITLMFITGTIVYQSLEIVMGNKALLTSEQINELIGSIVYLTMSVIFWWFGNRAQEKFKAR